MAERGVRDGKSKSASRANILGRKEEMREEGKEERREGRGFYSD